MKKLIKSLRVEEGSKVALKDWPAKGEPQYATKREYQKALGEHRDRLSALQSLLYASKRAALLLIFQGMDAAGKDGCIKHVLSGTNPLGCQAVAFGPPDASELKHDFLWRTTLALPERGRIGVFNRSYYEDVLVVRVHPELLAATGVKPPEDESFWHERLATIAAHERHLSENGTKIVKIFLNLSKEEQRNRLLERIDLPEKNWKITPSDIAERKHWKSYRQAYEAAIEATSTKAAPWYIVPADDKPTARLLVSQIVIQALEGLDLAYPKAEPEHEAALQDMRKQLESE